MRLALTLILGGMLAAPLAAQEQEQEQGPKKVEELHQKVLGGGVLGGGVPPTKQPPRDPRELSKKHEEDINRNWDRALKNYKGIIDGEEEANVKTMENRIESNFKLVKTQNKRLTGSQQLLRELKLRYARRFMILKTSYEQGRLNKTTYVQRLNKLANEFEFQQRGLVTDVKFYRREAATTKVRLKNLRQIHQLNMMTYHRKRPKQTEKELTALEKLLQSIRRAGKFQVQNVYDAADCRHIR